MKTVLVTGSSGLIGSEAVEYFHRAGHRVVGIDNNQRADFFGPRGDTTWNLKRLLAVCPGYVHESLDIRDRRAMADVVGRLRPWLLVHAAAQPSHDLSAQRPFDDFDTNAVGTLNLLEAVRQHSPETVFTYLSTNKVYGDGPNSVPLVELETRWEYARREDYNGIREDFAVDQCLHTVFGVSKVAADLMTQEYGRNFGIRTGVFRGGCLTGPNHSGVELHGFLNYLFKVAREGGHYTIFGYKGKQVRDNIHSFDVIRALEFFAHSPRPGEVYNMGGGRSNSCSMLEAIRAAEDRTGRRMNTTYTEQNRTGDHICYISDLSRFRSHYPEWDLTKPLEKIFDELAAGPVAWPARA